MSALDSLLEELGVDMTDERNKLSVLNYRNERDHMEKLRELRVAHRLSLQTIAARMGIGVRSLRELEGWDSDVTLARLRRYTLAIGATTTHSVREVEEL